MPGDGQGPFEEDFPLFGEELRGEDTRPLFLVPGFGATKLWFMGALGGGGAASVAGAGGSTQVWPPDGNTPGTAGATGVPATAATSQMQNSEPGEVEAHGLVEGVYEPLIKFITTAAPFGLGHTLGVDFWIFEYDWRNSNRKSGELFSAFVREKLDEANLKWRRARKLPDWRDADVVNHSMGGLVTRSAMINSSAPVARVAYLGSPHWGAPKAHFAIHGSTGSGVVEEFIDGFVALPEDPRARRAALWAIRQYLSTFDSIYELFPDPFYLDARGSVLDGRANPLVPTPVLGVDETYYKNPWRLWFYLRGMVDAGMRFKLSLGRDLPGRDNLVVYTNSQPTIDQAIYTDTLHAPSRPPTGDGTVPAYSANRDDHAQKYVSSAVHMGIPTEPAVHDALRTFFAGAASTAAASTAVAGTTTTSGIPAPFGGLSIPFSPPASTFTPGGGGDLEIVAIKFNHDQTGHSHDALNIRLDLDHQVEVPEWRRSAGQRYPAAYAIAPTRGNTITIQAKFRRVRGNATQYEVRAGGGAPLGSVKRRTITIGPSGESAYETFDLENTTFWFAGVAPHTVRWNWMCREATAGAWVGIERTEHQIFVVLDTPTAPWTQDGFPLETQMPWVSVLEWACRWASGATDIDAACQRVTEQVYALGPSVLEYDCWDKVNNPQGGGRSIYTAFDFECTAFVDRLNGGAGRGRYLNCSDCATIVSTFANILGASLWQSAMGDIRKGDPRSNGDGFELLPIRGIGATAFSLPCGSWQRFQYHEVAWTGACGNPDGVYDACLEVQPGELPINMPFGATGSGGYRDRLAKDTKEGRPLCNPHPQSRERRMVG